MCAVRVVPVSNSMSNGSGEGWGVVTCAGEMDGEEGTRHGPRPCSSFRGKRWLSLLG